MHSGNLRCSHHSPPWQESALYLNGYPDCRQTGGCTAGPVSRAQSDGRRSSSRTSGRAPILEIRNMPSDQRSSWLRRRVENAVRRAFTKAYDTIKVDPKHYLEHLRMAYN